MSPPVNDQPTHDLNDQPNYRLNDRPNDDPTDQPYLDTLNAAQRRAVTYGEPAAAGGFDAGPLLVVAGAGTGKTTMLAHRVAYLIVEGVDPQRVLLLTFTRRAAETMTRRADTIIRQALRRRDTRTSRSALLPWSGTFHSIGNRLLREFAKNLGLDPQFSVLDRGDAADLMDVVRHELGFSGRERRFPKKNTCLSIYSRCVNACEALADTLDHMFPWCGDWQSELRELFRAYVERKQDIQALDYDDLLLYWRELVRETEFAAAIGARFDHVLIDEYQDTNRLQAEIVHAIKPGGEGLTVVGDDAQSIYSFRAAEVENILGFADAFEPRAEVVTLERNYRSTQPILDSANCLIAAGARQHRKALFTDKAAGARPAYVTVEDGDAEVDYVVRRILEHREAGMALKDQAVLFRGSHHSDRLEIELVRRDIPYVKYGGLKFLEAAHVKDLLAILKWGENPRNEVAAFRVLKLLPGVGPALAARCFAHLAAAEFRFASLPHFKAPSEATADWTALCELLQLLAAAEACDPAWQGQLAPLRRWYQPQLERRYDAVDQRLADIDQLEQIAGRYPSRERFLTELTLDPPAGGAEACDPRLDEDYLILSTVHSAKGQEWQAVYVLNVTDGSFPSEFAMGDSRQIDEERRLLYVAMTRAKQSLALIAPLKFHVTQQHRSGDRHIYGGRSRFLTDAMLATMEKRFHGLRDGRDGEGQRHRPRPQRHIDVGARMRDMW